MLKDVDEITQHLDQTFGVTRYQQDIPLYFDARHSAPYDGSITLLNLTDKEDLPVPPEVIFNSVSQALETEPLSKKTLEQELYVAQAKHGYPEDIQYVLSTFNPKINKFSLVTTLHRGLQMQAFFVIGWESNARRENNRCEVHLATAQQNPITIALLQPTPKLL